MIDDETIARIRENDAKSSGDEWSDEKILDTCAAAEKRFVEFATELMQKPGFNMASVTIGMLDAFMVVSWELRGRASDSHDDLGRYVTGLVNSWVRGETAVDPMVQ